MTFYKIIIGTSIIGVSNSSNCFRFQPKHSMLIRAKENNMEYLECNNTLYHATWMYPIHTDIYQYKIANIVKIDEEEYNILVPAVQNAPVQIDTTEPEEIIPVELVDPVDEITLQYVREAKINEMSHACNQTIEDGFDITIEGEVLHFSLTIPDQLNLITLSSMAAQGIDEIPYHADGELCRFYTAAEINMIVNQATTFKTYHTTYFNALKAYINSLETIEEIGAVTYGMELPEAFKTDVLRSLE